MIGRNTSSPAERLALLCRQSHMNAILKVAVEASPENLEHSTQEEGHYVLLIIARVPQEVTYAILLADHVINMVIVSYRQYNSIMYVLLCAHTIDVCDVHC